MLLTLLKSMKDYQESERLNYFKKLNYRAEDQLKSEQETQMMIMLSSSSINPIPYQAIITGLT